MKLHARIVLALSLSGMPLASQSLKLPEAPGKVVTQKVCGTCHGAELMIGRQETREVWGAIVGDMVQRGAQGTDDEFYDVVDYLSANFSPSSPVTRINVNKASSPDLQTALHLPPKQADAIVQQRKEKGDFKSIEDLQKVPGIDAKKIDSNKKRLAF
jgi:competence protein ComEA